jgi:hypothetical protein
VLNPNRRQQRIELLRQGETQWGHSGTHRGVPDPSGEWLGHGFYGDPDCPPWRHHHHDIKCVRPLLSECIEAGVEWRRTWDSRDG